MDPKKTNEEINESTLTYSEQLTSMVKSNHHTLQLEKQMMEAKKHFSRKSKGELLDLILSTVSTNKEVTKTMKEKRKYYKRLHKSSLITILVKNWMHHKKIIDDQVHSEINQMPEEAKEKVMEMAAMLADGPKDETNPKSK